MTENAIAKRTPSFPAAVYGLGPPVQRSAYSDRTAWLMATLSELSYRDIYPDDPDRYVSFAKDLAMIAGNHGYDPERHSALRLSGKARGRTPESARIVLRSILSAGNFTLLGMIHNEETDVEGFVAKSRARGQEMIVVCFSGTSGRHDWMLNLAAEKTRVTSRNTERPEILGYVHKGYDRGVTSVARQIMGYVDRDKSLPIFVTGHSSGGALATLATWYLNKDRLAACYTFGAPRVGDSGLLERFHTPIYRVVNGADPVPLIPPRHAIVEWAVSFLESVNRLNPWRRDLSSLRTKYGGYVHYGEQHYLTICQPDPSGAYPDLQIRTNISEPARILRFISRVTAFESIAFRVHKYHKISEYRKKLKAYAIRRQREKI